MLNRLATLLRKVPMKSIFITIIIVVLFVTGVRNVFMATGNETMVKTDTDVYQDNVVLEEEFGGESIIVLYEAEDLLIPSHLTHMKGLENALEMSDSIYSVISPVTLVEEIAGKQSDTFQEGIEEIIEGLDDMGSQLSEIGEELQENAKSSSEMKFPEIGEFGLPDLNEPELPELGGIEFPELEGPQLPEFGGLELPDLEGAEISDLGGLTLPDMEGQMKELHEAFSGMKEAQENLGEGTGNLIGGYVEFSNQLNELGESLKKLAAGMEDSSEKKQLQQSSQKLIGLSEQMSQVSEETGQLPVIPNQTIEGLNNIQEKLEGKLQEQKQQLEKQKEKQTEVQAELQEKQEQMKQEMQKQQESQEAEMKQKMEAQQNAQEEEIKRKMQEQQVTQRKEMKQEMQVQLEAQKENMKTQMEVQRAEKEKEMEELKNEMQEKREDQAEMLGTIGEGLTTMGENLQLISENMETMYGYRDIMTPGLPENQATLDHMVYDDDGVFRPMFEEVIVDDNHMIMMVKLEGNTSDEEKSEVIDMINTYLDKEKIDTAETLVSGKPVLDHAIKSSMQESIRKMMGLALLIMVVVLFFVFRVRLRLMPLVTVLVAVIGTMGLMGWLQIPITMVSMAVFPILIGLGIDYAIQFQNRYSEEMAKEDSNESQ